MKPAPFGYFAPTNVDEVRDFLNQYGDDAKILAEGQSLVPVMALWLSQPSVVIDINGVRELDYIRDGAHGLAIGAIINVISDALGVTITQQPLTPTRILELMGAIMPD